jgi:hypothetical protein
MPAGRRQFFLTTAKLFIAGLTLFVGVTCPSVLGAQMQAPVVGQNAGTTRSIEGLVLDAKGKPITGAVVLLKNTKTLQVRSYIAQPDGSYRFFGLSTDINYQLRAQAQGLTSKTKTVSVFNSRKVVKLDLKVVKKVKS